MNSMGETGSFWGQNTKILDFLYLIQITLKQLEILKNIKTLIIWKTRSYKFFFLNIKIRLKKKKL